MRSDDNGAVYHAKVQIGFHNKFMKIIYLFYSSSYNGILCHRIRTINRFLRELKIM